MAKNKYPFDEYTKVAWVPSIADISSPNAVEIEAGTDLSCMLTKDGLALNLTNNMVDGGELCTRFDAQTAGSVGASPVLRMYRYHDDDEAWDLVNWGDTGHLVIRRGHRVSVPWGVSQDIEVYAGQFGEPQMANSAANTNQTFEVAIAVSAMDQKATVGASS